LATKDNKQRRSIVVSSICEVCGTEVESAMHAVVRCGHAKALREAMRQIWSLPDEEQFMRLSPDSLPSQIDNVGVDDGARLLLLLWRT
ncbi:hypothetical protein BAE44_0020820, partial [Dichanthelium oligosanthes]